MHKSCLAQILYLGKIWFQNWAEMLLTNQIARFLNQIYLKNKMMKQLGFLDVDTNSWKLKVG